MNRGSPGWVWTAFFLLVSFLAGATVERVGWLHGRSGCPSQRTLEPFCEAWNLIEDHYVDRGAVQPEAMRAGAIEGMLDALGDVGHTAYLSPDELKQLESSLEGHFTGIGARMTVRKSQPTVVQVMPHSPAEKAGLKPGDVLQQVNGKDVHALPLPRIVELVRGPEGTIVDLRVLRSGESKPLEFHITRGKVPVENIVWHMLPGTHIAHVAIQEFGTDADQQLRAALQEMREQGVRGLLVDLRANPGGLKDQAVAVTSEFLKGGVVFWEQDANGQRTAVNVEPGGVATDLPICVLIDEGTASSAEIFAGAIQDHGRGPLVGTRTFGTGTVLRPFALVDGSAILLAVAQWLTPKERLIWHHGIEPDHEVALPNGTALLMPYEEGNLTAKELEKSQDQQLLAGLKVLREKIH